MNDIDKRRGLYSEAMRRWAQSQFTPDNCGSKPFEMMAQTLEKEKPKKPKGISITFEGRVGNCPSCNKLVRESMRACDCGQRLEW